MTVACDRTDMYECENRNTTVRGGVSRFFSIYDYMCWIPVVESSLSTTVPVNESLLSASWIKPNIPKAYFIGETSSLWFRIMSMCLPPCQCNNPVKTHPPSTFSPTTPTCSYTIQHMLTHINPFCKVSLLQVSRLLKFPECEVSISNNVSVLHANPAHLGSA